MLTSPYSSDLYPDDTTPNPDAPPTRTPRKVRKPTKPVLNPQLPAPRSPATTAVLPEAPAIPALGQPRAPMDERLPDGRSVADLLASLNKNPVAPPPTTGPAQPYKFDPHVGIETAGMSRLGKRIAQIQALKEADPTANVSEEPWGYEEGPPQLHPSRKHQILMGLLQGAVIGGQRGLGGALGGAAAGAGVGAVNPRLMAALTRQQNIDYLQRGVSADQALEEQQAQNIYAQQRPEIERDKLRSQVEHELALEEQARQNELGRNQRSIAEIADRRARSEAERKTQIDVANIRSRGGASGSGAIAAEGKEDARQAEQDIPGVQGAISKWGEDNTRDAAWMKQVESDWNTEALKQYKAAKDKYLPGMGAEPKLSEILDEVRRSDSRYADYERTKANYEQRTKDINEEQKKLETLNKERRGGKGKAARGTVSSTNAPKGTVEGAVAAFKAKMKRDPTPEELANLQRYYSQ